jgi:metal-responsive CopG/Arc/MetJ family transcriptional regulator
MTEVLTVRLPIGLLSKLDNCAARHGRARSEHIRHLIETDASKPAKIKSAQFATLHLKGRHALGRGSSNAAVRAALTHRAYEKNR